MFLLAVRYVTCKRSGKFPMTSRALRPMDPVEPRIAMLHGRDKRHLTLFSSSYVKQWCLATKQAKSDKASDSAECSCEVVLQILNAFDSYRNADHSWSNTVTPELDVAHVDMRRIDRN